MFLHQIWRISSRICVFFGIQNIRWKQRKNEKLTWHKFDFWLKGEDLWIVGHGQVIHYYLLSNSVDFFIVQVVSNQERSRERKHQKVVVMSAPKGGKHCCVVGCSNGSVKNRTAKFFNFPAESRNKEQRKLWVAAVKRLDSEGRPWLPSKWSRICSEHFVGGQWSPTSTHPAYVPTIFPTKHVKKRSQSDVDRYERMRKRRKSGTG